MNMNLLELIKSYPPYNAQEEKDKAIIVSCLEKFEDILTRENKIIHLTSSAFVVNKKRDKVLMVHHNIYKSWSWIGGHADGEKDLFSVALKEVAEETGIKNVRPVSEEIFSLDIIPVQGHIKKGEYVSPHLHISVAYLLEAEESEPLMVKPDENSAVSWLPIDKIASYSNEPHMIRIYQKVIAKLRENSSR